MASLREMRTRINSVQSTQKITSVIKVVALAKLHGAQGATEDILPYQGKLNKILTSLLSADLPVESPFCVERPVGHIATIAFSPSSSLCGAFNANVLKMFLQTAGEYHELGQDNILIYPTGKKIEETVKKLGFFSRGSYQRLTGKPSYDGATALVRLLMELFPEKSADRMELVYHHLRSTGIQELLRERYLPIDLSAVQNEDKKTEMVNDYIIEPPAAQLIVDPILQVLSQEILTTTLDSNVSERAARALAIQITANNANELTQELTKQYNKTRQQAIISELFDIVGGSMA